MNETALILAAHGSGPGSRANEQVRRFARRLRGERQFAEVHAAFNLGNLRFDAVLNHIRTKRVVVVPIMTSEGYFSQVVLKRALQNRSNRHDVEITPVIGTHPQIIRLVEQTARTALQAAELAADETGILVVGHGTTRHRQSRNATEEVAARLRDLGRFARVVSAFLDDFPRLEEAVDRLGNLHAIAVPFLLGGGSHALVDIPRRLQAGQAIPGRRRITASAIGANAALLDIIRNRAMAGAMTLKKAG